MGACLCVEDCNGKLSVSLYSDKRTVHQSVHNRRETGFTRLIDVADGDADLGLDMLKRLYLQQIDPQPKPAGQAKAEAAQSKEAETQSLKMSKSELVRILDGIIRTSNQRGEIDAALSVYERVTGKEWRC